MSYYNYDKFVHPVSGGRTIPKDTQVRRVDQSRHFTETFFTTLGDFGVPSSSRKTYYLDYDITAPKLPEKINSVIYNVHTLGKEFPVAVYQGSRIWTAFTELGDRASIYTRDIESFDATPSSEEDES